MSALPVKVYQPVSLNLNPPTPTAVATPVVLTLPKVREHDGKLVETTIFSDKILGAEPCTVTYKGKAYQGVKIYTVVGFFKTLTTPEAFANGAAHALHTGQAVKLTAKAPLLLGKGK